MRDRATGRAEGPLRSAARAGSAAHPLVDLQRAAGNRATALAVQRAVGYEFEASSWGSYQPRGLSTLSAAIANPPNKAKRIDKGETLVKGTGFELQADDRSGGGSDIEFVTDAFAETDKAGVAAAANGIVTMFQDLDNLAQQAAGGRIRVKDLPTGNVKMKRAFLSPGYLSVKPQTTLGIRLDQVFEVLKEIGLAQGGETPKETQDRMDGRQKLMSLPTAGTQPGHAITRVGNATTEVEAALAAHKNANAPLANWAPTDSAKGFLALLFTYMEAAKNTLPDYAKAIAPIMARTDFAKIFDLIPPNDRAILGANGGTALVTVMGLCPAFGAMNMTLPLFEGGIHANTGAPSPILDDLKRDAWLKGITKGVDLLTQKKFPSKKKSARAEIESLGSLGKKTEGVGNLGIAAPIFELRGMAGNVPVHTLPALTEAIRKYAKHKNRNDPRAFGQ